MPQLLSDLRVVEVSAFIAAPLGGMTLAQLGADVIRIDPIGGNIDYRRWPVSDANGTSLYWTALNKGKRSVTLALDTPQGRELAQAIITASGENAGILLSNLPASGWMGYDALSAKRADLIMLRLTGNPDGSAAVDYTVNCASGFPMATGRGGEPVNHVLPAWDVAAGLYLATGLLAAERHRRRTGQGQEVTVALADVMLATVGNLGYFADVRVNGAVRQPIGNDLYGAYGHDFPTKDGRRAMAVAISNRQWRALGKATGLADKLAMVGPLMGVDMDDEGGRFQARDAISAVLAPWFAARTLVEVEAAFTGSGVLWGPYRDFGQLVAEDRRCTTANPLLREIEQPEVGPLLVPGSPLSFPALGERTDHRPAPVLGQDTDAVLGDLLGLSSAEIGRLHDEKVVG
ncbi:CoA transferase [Azospirillum doebereinerae]